jgi:two-component system response regulator GlrR
MTTTRVVDDPNNPRLLRRKVLLEVLRGSDKGKRVVASKDEINIGTLPSNDLELGDPAISRYHLRIATGVRGLTITDLDSTNGTFTAGMRIHEIEVQQPTEVMIGDTVVRIAPLDDEVEVPLYPTDTFGRLLGRSPQMRTLFAQLEPIAASNATVLIEGETGTGKELFAEEIHSRSKRRDGPFIVVDCGALPDNLVESELFGHVRGAFTGATTDRAGAFELAKGGTLFLDEIGEMAAVAQPRLLRVLEGRQVKRVGSDRYRDVDVRIVAATNRDLRLAVNEGMFRADLYYRLSVMRLKIPALRERKEDIELLARSFLRQSSEQIAPGKPPPQMGPETLQRLVAHRWPGNARELRNFMQRVAVLAHGGASLVPEAEALEGAGPPASESQPTAGIEVDLPYKEAKARWIDRFEVEYVSRLLDENENNVAAAARQAGVDRTYLFRLIRKYGLRD